MSVACTLHLRRHASMRRGALVERRRTGKIARAQRGVARIDAQPTLHDVQEVLCEPARLRIVGALESGWGADRG